MRDTFFTDTIIDAAKAASGAKSERAFATILGINHKSLHGWRLGISYPTDENLVRMCNIAGIDPVENLLRFAAIKNPGIAGDIYLELAEEHASIHSKDAA